MKKNIVQDVVFPKRSIKEVTLPSRRAKMNQIEDTNPVPPVRPRPQTQPRTGREEVMRDEPIVVGKIPTPTPPPQPPRPVQNPRAYNYEYDIDTPVKEKRTGLWIALAVFMVAVLFGVSALFTKATVYVEPHMQTVPVDITLKAPKDPSSGEFGFQIVSATKSVDKTVPATSEEQTSLKASGTITIYNNASDKPQKLIANTRFENGDGLVYRIKDAVTVPGKQTQAGKTIPGSIDAVVYADQPGEKYNIGLSDFTLPGLKGDARYKDIYARSKTAMSGGFVGMMKKVDSAVLASATTELGESLKSSLSHDLKAQIPQNFITYDSAVSYVLEPISQVSGGADKEAKIVAKGTVYALIFDKALLSREILTAEKSSLNLEGTAQVVNLETLTVTPKTQNVFKDKVDSVDIGVTGDAKVSWVFDESMLKTDLMEMSKKDINTLLESKYPSINKIKATIRPFWKMSFPKNPEKIEVVKVDSIDQVK